MMLETLHLLHDISTKPAAPQASGSSVAPEATLLGRLRVLRRQLEPCFQAQRCCWQQSMHEVHCVTSRPQGRHPWAFLT